MNEQLPQSHNENRHERPRVNEIPINIEARVSSLTVLRSNDEEDTGWNPASLYRVEDESGSEKQYVHIYKPTSEAILEKMVPLERVIEKNPNFLDRLEAYYGEEGRELRRQFEATESREQAEIPPLSIEEIDEQARAQRVLAIGLSAIEARQVAVSQEKLEQEGEERARRERLFAFPQPRGRDSYGNDLDRRLRVTEESEADAVTAYRFMSDAVLKDMIDEYKTDDVWREEDIPEIMRTNDDLRIAVGSYVLDKLKTMDGLPDRVYRNTEKNINYTGYERGMTSQEAVAELVLSFLDGTYSRTSDNDAIELNKWSEAIQGQHRWAALKVLGLDKAGDNYVGKVIKIKRPT